MQLLLVGTAAAIWCLLHTVFVSHRWRDLIRTRRPALERFRPLLYALGATISLAVLFLWIFSLPAKPLWNWPGWWAWLRWAGLAEAGFLLWQGARVFDGRTLLGLRQLSAPAFSEQNRESAADQPLRTDGILGSIRHPWYTGAMLLLIFGLPVTDVNLVWRAVFLAYIPIGTELEERKLLKDLGEPYAEYRRQVPRFVPLKWG